MGDQDIYLAKGYKVDKLIDRPMIFFHVPKAAGTTVGNILSILFNSNIRISGLVTRPSEKLQNNYEYRLDVSKKKYSHTHSALDQFYEKKSQIDLTSKKLIFGHFPYEITNDIADIDSRIKMTILRDPIQRCQSHINYFISKGIIKSPIDIPNILKDRIVESNLLTRQFSGKSNVNYVEDEHVKSAIKNIKKLDFIFEINQIQHLLNTIISIYDFPNILYQSINVTSDLNPNIQKYQFTDEDNEIIKKYNQYDIDFYSRIGEEKLFFKAPIDNKVRDKNQTLLISTYLSPVLEIIDNKRLSYYLNKIKETNKTFVTT